MTDAAAFQATIGRPKGTTESVVARLERNSIPVPEAGCWLWMGELCRLGYGLMRIQGKVKKAHRISFAERNGPIPNGLSVLHRCDVRCCINPDHLFLGTRADNVADMDKKGRRIFLAGLDNGRAKLTEDDVREIRSSTLNDTETAALFGVSRNMIGNIRSGRNWTHI